MDDPRAPQYESAALITIDVQCDTLDGQPLEVPGTSSCLPHIGSLAAAFRGARLPIVHLVRLYVADGSNAEACRQALVRGPTPVFRPGTPGRSIAPGILGHDAPELDDDLLLTCGHQRLGPSEIAMYKPRWGAFFRTQLDGHLQSLGVTTVVFAGCNFPNCPRTSIYQASERDYRIVLAADAVSGLYERGASEMRNIGVHVIHSDDIIREVLANAQSEPR